jgi:hypothetical protein
MQIRIAGDTRMKQLSTAALALGAIVIGGASGCMPNTGYRETTTDAGGEEHKSGTIGWETTSKKGFQPAKVHSEPQPLPDPPPISDMVIEPPAKP